MLSRRAFLLSASATALAAAMPASLNAAAPVAAGVDLSTKPDMLAYAVGTPGEWDWQAIRASSPEEAFREWVWSRWGDDEDAPVFDPDFVERVEQWDSLTRISPADWLDIGLGHHCERCGYETHRDAGARVVAGEVVCEECLTFADRVAIDPDDVVEDIANRIADEGEAETRDWLERQKASIPEELWQRAVREAQN
ncbi:MAG: hypothetical protein M9955_04515 [Rhizobiaceae bacterium]|nr:hypothetical protein [Rhizobiaceae bacterium]